MHLYSCFCLLTGTHTMALLEKLDPGNVYLVKISASNQVGDGPFSGTVELVPKRGNTHRSKNPRHSDKVLDTTGRHDGGEGAVHWLYQPVNLQQLVNNDLTHMFVKLLLFVVFLLSYLSLNSCVWYVNLFVSLAVFSDGLYHIDQKSMTGIIVGVCIALACIVMCALILITKGRPRYWV